jgi:predicted phosphodiesterase
VLSVALVGAGAIVVDRLVRDRDAFIRSIDGDRAVVWAVGDGANGSEDGRAVAKLIARGPVDAVIYLGDVYDEGTAEDFEENYDTTYGSLSRLTAPTSGNHDDNNEDEGYDPYWRRAHGERPPDWYTFEAGGWTILSLDSELDDDAASAQQRWLEDQLGSPGTCRIAFWHRPRFSAGTHHGDDEDMEPVWNALRGHAAIVLSGHEHDMQRFKPIDGITQFVSGAGGAELYSLDSDDRLAFGDDDSYGALRLDLRRGVARHAFVAADGRTLDSGTIRCRPLG